MINNQFAVSGQDDGATLMPAMFITILVLVDLLLRSVLGVLMTFIIILLSATAGLASLGWTGTPLNSVTVLAPFIISVLAVASTVHVLASVRQTMQETPNRREWTRRALADHSIDIAVACLSTTIGFFSLNFSISPPFRELGNTVGFGVLVAMVLTLTLLPSLVMFLPMRQQKSQASARRLLMGLCEFVIGNRKALPPLSVIVVAVLGFGVAKLVAEDDFIRYFDDRYEFRAHTDFIEDNLTGINAIEWSVDSGEPEGINDPAYLKHVAAFADDG